MAAPHLPTLIPTLCSSQSTHRPPVDTKLDMTPLCSEPSQDSYLTQVRSPGPGDFPNGPVVKTPCSHCREHGFHPWLGNEDPACCRPWPRGEESPSPSYSPRGSPSIIFPSPCSPQLLLSSLHSLSSCHTGLLHVHNVPQGLCAGHSVDLESSLQPSHSQLATPGLSPPCSTTDMKQLPVHYPPSCSILISTHNCLLPAC